ncbi:MAG TPA: CoA pyrophosphatase [Candidatus Dormibacteraeota bacterium]|nr:CoA pyrophosphatase [Candidatus Dormibacteraeota bacterium]
MPPEVSAAVLLLVDPSDPGLPLLFIRRSRRVRTHRGQIAFPGGAIDPEDAGVVEAALREGHEELGIPPDLVEPLGLLTTVWTRGSERSLCPVVGLQRAEVSPVADGSEVDTWFRIPLAELLEAPLTSRHIPGMPATAVVHFIEAHGQVIWGATAAVLLDLLQRLRIAMGALPQR